MNEVENELREMRNLNKRYIPNELSKKYRDIFTELPPLHQKVMKEYYINCRSYHACGQRVYYCERQIRRIIDKSKEKIREIMEERELK